MSREKWYQDGLRFQCTQCGNCCRGSTGYVWMTDDERQAIAEHLMMDLQTFTKTCARRVGFKYSLRERGRQDNWDCVFLVHENEKRICSIYPVRPLQCCVWPFWRENLKTRSAWEAAAASCTGINQGKHYEFVQIEIERSRRS